MWRAVRIIQRWDGQGPSINYLLRDFRRWLIDEKMKQRLASSRKARSNHKIVNNLWIEKLLQTPLSDYRKFAVWHILAPYLINIRKYSADEAYDAIRNWLSKCSQLRQSQFSPNCTIKYNINSARRGGYLPTYLPTSLGKLKTENRYLYNVLAKC